MKKNNQKSKIGGIFILLSVLYAGPGFAQKINDSNTPLHLLQPEYDVPYGKPEVKDIELVIDRVYNYLDKSTPMTLVDKTSGKEITDYSKVDKNTIFLAGDFRLISYEWGVTYSGMTLATKETGNAKYAKYTNDRIQFIADILPYFKKLSENHPEIKTPVNSVLHPHALDDAGAMCAAIIKAQQSGDNFGFDPIINNYIDYISNKEFRLKDGTFARNRPQPNTLWHDDLFMSVPALANKWVHIRRI